MRRYLPLLAVLGLGCALRVWGIGFGLPHTLTRPDEEAVVSIALRFFRRTLNPGFFDWPSLFMYVVSGLWAIYFNVGRLAGWPWFGYETSFVQYVSMNPTPFHLIARGLSAVAGVLTVSTVHRVGTRLFDRTTALVSALFLAVSALHVRDSHFGVTDVAATWLVMESFLSTVRYDQTARLRHAISSAVWAGLAASTKYNAVLIVLPGVWAVAGKGFAGARSWSAVARLLAAYAGVTAAVFVAGTPYAALDPQPFLSALRQVGAHLQGGHAALAGYGWLVHLSSSLRHGVGLPLLGAGIGGLVLHIRQNRPGGVLLALFPVVYFAVIGAGQTAFARYIIPVVPFLCLGAGYITVRAACALAEWSGRPVWTPVCAWSLALALAAPSASSALRTDRLLARTDNRLLAAIWMRDEFRGGVSLYQSGAGYAHVQMQTADAAAARFHDVSFDEGAGAFRDADGAQTTPPDVIVVPECPLAYCAVPDGLRGILRRDYELSRAFIALDASYSGLRYDRDDAFFVPLAGFGGVERPGPNLAIHVRRDLAGHGRLP